MTVGRMVLSLSGNPSIQVSLHWVHNLSKGTQNLYGRNSKLHASLKSDMTQKSVNFPCHFWRPNVTKFQQKCTKNYINLHQYLQKNCGVLPLEPINVEEKPLPSPFECVNHPTFHSLQISLCLELSSPQIQHVKWIFWGRLYFSP